tara:strand:- start:148 stop:285 length:138 start_codon:yes stop_codon:yes gene_type:complete
VPPKLVVLGETYLYNNLGDFTKKNAFTWRVSDCEKFVGGYGGLLA